jgi:hypothetical protein
MKKLCAIFGVLLVLGAKFFALVNWGITSFTEIYYERGSPGYFLNVGTWLFDILGMGLGVLLIGVAAMLSDPRPPQGGQ